MNQTTADKIGIVMDILAPFNLYGANRAVAEKIVNSLVTDTGDERYWKALYFQLLDLAMIDENEITKRKIEEFAKSKGTNANSLARANDLFAELGDWLEQEDK